MSEGNTYWWEATGRESLERIRLYDYVDEPSSQHRRLVNASSESSVNGYTVYQSIRIWYLPTIAYLPYRLNYVSIRQSFVCYLELSPARQSATSGFDVRSTLGKSLLREEVLRNYTRNGYASGYGVGGIIYRSLSEYGYNDMKVPMFEIQSTG